jgi:hypothetical protein
MATFKPAFASSYAAIAPAGPEPTTSTSQVQLILIKVNYKEFYKLQIKSSGEKPWSQGIILNPNQSYI